MRVHYLLLASLGASPALGQPTPKKPLDHSVYDQWQSVANQRISPDGRYVLYQVKPQQGDGTLYLKASDGRLVRQLGRGDSAAFSADSRFAVASLKPRYQDVRQARIKKKKPEQMPKDSLAVVTLGTGQVRKYAGVKSYQLAEEGPALAFLGVKMAVKDSLQKKAPVDTVKKITDKLLETKKEGALLTVLNLATGQTRTFEAVTDYQLSKPGNRVAFAVSAPKGSKDMASGLYVYELASGRLRRVSAGKGVYKNLAFDEAGQQLAFAAEKFPEKTVRKPFSLYYADLRADSARVLLAPGAAGLPAGWSPSAFGKIFFSERGEKLFFGTAPDPIPQDTTLVEFEHAKLDIWNYKDDYLQPMQLKTLKKDLQRNYLAVIYPKAGVKLVQLEDEYLRDSYVAERNDAEFVLALTDTAKRVAMQWEGGTRKQAYLVSTRTGQRVAINPKAAKSRFQLSPDGQFVVWYDYEQKNWFAFEVATRKTTNLTAKTGVAFADEENDSPTDPEPYGVAAWVKNDAAVLLYDRYDIWKVNPRTGQASNFTGGLGRRQHLSLRTSLPRDKQRCFEPAETVWLLTQADSSKQWGYYRKSLSSRQQPQPALPLAPLVYSPLQQAKHAPVFLYTTQSVQQSADLYASRELRQPVRLTTINPQQAQYNWLTAELVHWTTPKGHAATGVLYKPENFDPAKKYPMVVYFYEKLSDNVYRYVAPAPSASTVNPALFASNGYLIFMPDISYTVGEPGPSATEYVNSGVEELKKNVWVDGAHIGLQGQSWGGYQVAYLITQTNMYAAAWAGAPVVNMTSAYGGIRWESGQSRQFQYERTQSRIGGTLWEKPDLYIRNSPLFSLPKVQTPVVIMSNDADGAVPWYQGIEMFTDLRRLGKPVWLLQYNGEAHNLVKRENRKDISIRELQFFDHYLKGAPAPVWLQTGVPAVEKGRNWGFELTTK